LTKRTRKDHESFLFFYATNKILTLININEYINGIDNLLQFDDGFPTVVISYFINALAKTDEEKVLDYTNIRWSI
jgi:hypothetical protein